MDNDYDYRQASVEMTKSIGEEPGFWDRFRNQPPPFANEDEVTVAIIDALTQEGIAAWSGDATGCVAQMVMAQMEDRRKTLKLLRRAHMALLMYTQSHGTPHTELMTEMAECLGVEDRASEEWVKNHPVGDEEWWIEKELGDDDD